VFFEKGKEPVIAAGLKDDIDPPGDRDRLEKTAGHVFQSVLNVIQLAGSGSIFEKVRNMADALLGLGEVDCQVFVKNNFMVFANVQEASGAKHRDPSRPITITEARLDQSFFFTGLPPDGSGEILWGFSQWCRLLHQDTGR